MDTSTSYHRIRFELATQNDSNARSAFKLSDTSSAMDSAVFRTAGMHEACLKEDCSEQFSFIRPFSRVIGSIKNSVPLLSSSTIFSADSAVAVHTQAARYSPEGGQINGWPT